MRPLRIIQWNRLARTLVPAVSLVCLVLLGFARLVRNPTGLLVDCTRSSVDATLPDGETRPLGNDLTRLFLPHHLRIANAIANTGRVPTWDPAGFGGRPLVGNPQAGLWYPAVWLFWRMPVPSLLCWLTVAHLAWGGLGTLGLARRSGLSPLPSFVAASCFSLNPYILAQTYEGHYPHVWAACWYPWAFWAALAGKNGDARGLVALPAILALALSTGHPQEGFLLALALAVWHAMQWTRRNCAQSRDLRPQLVGPGLVACATLALCAIEWLPVAALRDTMAPQTRVSLRNTQSYSVAISNLAQVINPWILGGPSDYRGSGNYWETLVSWGGLAFVLIALAFVMSRAKERPAMRGWFWLVIMALVFAVGRPLGLYAISYQLIPGMSYYRVPARALFLAALGGSMLAGFGAMALRRHPRLLTCLASAALAELLLHCWLLIPVSPVKAWTEPRSLAAALLRTSPSEPFRIRAKAGAIDELTAARLGLEMTDLYDWYQVAHAAELYQRLYLVMGRERPIDWLDPIGACLRREISSAVLDRMGVARIVSDRPLEDSRWPVLAQGIDRGRPFAILSNRSAMPRAYVVPRAESWPSVASAVEHMAWIDPREAVLMSEDPLASSSSDSRQPFRPAAYRAISADHIVIDVRTEAAGLLVIGDTWMPGWSAVLDGRRVPVWRGNWAQRVVTLATPGQHHIELRYEPPWLAVGASISAVAWTTWLLTLIVVCVKRMRCRLRHDHIPARPYRISNIQSRGSAPDICNPQALSHPAVSLAQPPLKRQHHGE